MRRIAEEDDDAQLEQLAVVREEYGKAYREEWERASQRKELREEEERFFRQGEEREKTRVCSASASAARMRGARLVGACIYFTFSGEGSLGWCGLCVYKKR